MNNDNVAYQMSLVSRECLKTKDKEFWKAFPKGEPKGYDKFLALAKKGKPRKAWNPGDRAGLYGSLGPPSMKGRKTPNRSRARGGGESSCRWWCRLGWCPRASRSRCRARRWRTAASARR